MREAQKFYVYFTWVLFGSVSAYRPYGPIRFLNVKRKSVSDNNHDQK